jgi:signal transduction histidine kinase
MKMKFSTRLIFYYLSATLISMTIVGMAVSQGIKIYGMKAVEEILIEQSSSASVFIKQTLYLEKQQSIDIKRNTAARITNNLSLGNRHIRIYNKDLNLLSASINGVEQNISQDMGQSKHLYSALQGNYSYTVIHNDVFFASPVEFLENTIGVLEIVYPLNFFEKVLNTSITILIIGAIIFNILIMILSIYIAKVVTKPIQLLVEATARYSQRDFTPIEIHRTDEIGKLGKSFNLMGSQLQNYIHMQKQFVANVSHELRTPLTAIRGYSEYLMDEIKGRADLEKAIFHLYNESNRLAKLVDELLLLSRIEAQQQFFQMLPLNFTKLVEDSIEKMEFKADRNNINVHKELEQEVYTKGDKDKLIQAIVNIIDNAIKYSPELGKVIVMLKKEDNQAKLTVLNNGPGIKADDLDKVFERFYRASNVKGIVGTGLGLSITREIIVAHEGTIRLENRTEGGTAVYISLPLD